MVSRLRYTDRDVRDRLCTVGHILRKKIDVGEVRADLTIKNGVDAGRAAAGLVPADEVRQTVADAVVDTGVMAMVLPRTVADAIEVPTLRTHTVVLAGGAKHEAPVVGPLVLTLLGREFAQEAVVFGGEVLIGQMGLEATDLWIDCQNRVLTPNPDSPDRSSGRI